MYDMFSVMFLRGGEKARWPLYPSRAIVFGSEAGLASGSQHPGITVYIFYTNYIGICDTKYAFVFYLTVHHIFFRHDFPFAEWPPPYTLFWSVLPIAMILVQTSSMASSFVSTRTQYSNSRIGGLRRCDSAVQ